MIRKILASFGLCAFCWRRSRGADHRRSNQLLTSEIGKRRRRHHTGIACGTGHSYPGDAIHPKEKERPPLRNSYTLRDTGAERIDHTHAP